MLRLLLILSLVASLASCGRLGIGNASSRADTDVALPFKARLSKGEDRAFTVSVAHKGSGVAEVRESVRFEATKYCILTYGGSDADWLIDPATNDWAFNQDGDRLIFQGECTAR
jgi:hypothetical protein